MGGQNTARWEIQTERPEKEGEVREIPAVV